MKKVMFSDKVDVKEYDINEPIEVLNIPFYKNYTFLFFIIFTFLFIFIFLD